jgi:polyisoprenoid-binding protein YceI
MRIKFTLLTLLVSFGILKAQSDWSIDKNHTNIKFTVTHMMVSEVDGEFTDFAASVRNAGEDFSGADVEFTAKTTSVDTHNEIRDKDLRSDNFFDVEKYPDITFKGKITREGEKYFLVGDFTMKDVTKQVKFDVRYNGKIDSGRGMKAGFKVIASINRFDYNLKWNRAVEAGGLVVGEEVIITCNIELNEARG